MGFTPKRTQYRLKFDKTTDLDGLEITTRSVSVGQLMDLQRFGSELAGAEDDDFAPEAIEKMVDLLASGIVEWNVEDEEGRPVEPTTANLLAQDLPFIYAVLTAWSQAMSGISESLGKDSTSGESFPEESLPMETLSPSLAS